MEMLAVLVITQLQFQAKACEVKSLCEIVASFQLDGLGTAEEGFDYQPSLPYEIDALTKEGGRFRMRLENETQPNGKVQMILRLIFQEAA